jgi:hypothetical protein
MRTSPGANPDTRLRSLTQKFSAIVTHHRQYAQLRQATKNRNEARRQAGAHLGLDYLDQTTIIHAPNLNSIAQVRERLANDVHAPGDAATWTLVFQNQDRHAIAGFCGITGTEPILKHQIHIFDPNIGEYVCSRADLDKVIQSVLVNYSSPIVEVCRTTEGEFA